MIKLRRLKDKDADNMLEWLCADNLSDYFRMDATNINKDSVLRFINESFTQTDRNYAIVNEEDEYLGTISLKHINCHDKNAEYAISLREKAKGSGVASIATDLLLEIAFKELELIKVYLNVFENNQRAREFYEKKGFIKEGVSEQHVIINGEFRSLVWYAFFKERKI